MQTTLEGGQKAELPMIDQGAMQRTMIDHCMTGARKHTGAHVLRIAHARGEPSLQAVSLALRAVLVDFGRLAGVQLAAFCGAMPMLHVGAHLVLRVEAVEFAPGVQRRAAARLEMLH